ncbi:MAG TPA: T9SS type A sorting domain-containing protein [Candidatus Eisenbacteria bacterium]|nr:T9SS type A sorting domain-containing protein [Candidatus Eisenbacteria bacterium]
MRKVVAFFLAAAFICSAATAFAAAKYPPGPGGTCPDSLTIVQCENPAALCHPATLDTVLGVRGVITGFDAIPTGFGFYMETVDGAPWSGIDVFTGSANYNAAVPGTPTGGNLAIGDSVVVYGRMQEFPVANGTTEIEGPDGVTSSNDIIIRKISSGNPLPPFAVLSTKDLNWIPGLETTPGFAEQYEGMLVRVRGPLTIARRQASGSNAGLFGGTYLCYNPSDPSDSIMVDEATLAGLVPPAVGTVLDSVQGLLNEGASNGLTSYRIQIRSGADQFAQLPPNLLDAWPIEDTKILCKFDTPITPATATNAGNYSLSSFGSVNTATQIAPDQVVLDITNGLSDGDNEGVTVNNLTNASSGLSMTSPQSRTFFNGVLTAAEVQQPDPASLSGTCVDRSRMAGTGSAVGGRMSVRGVCTATLASSLNYIADPGNPARGGVAVFAPLTQLIRGHQYLLAGGIQEFNGETEFTSNVYAVDEGPVAGLVNPVNTAIAVLRDSTCDATQTLDTGEDYEGRLVSAQYGSILANKAAGGSFTIYDPTVGVGDSIFVRTSGAGGAITFTPTAGHAVTVTGILHWNFGAFEIDPRNNADIQDHGNVGVPSTPKSLTFAVYPNPARSAEVNFGLPKAADVELGVYDISGRAVAVLTRGRLDAGNYSRTWNGLDNGHTAHAGMYFVRLRVGGETRTLRAIHLN